ncbi:MAG: ectoine/hydroxyectoine ABC transporter permease subunit EhuC [Pseudomonas sp.]|jgi:polar amino acid transport system permease protein|uniref:Amino acid ABC transporter membrane protein 1 (PAAT family) n=1 Tax=Stutzerimonas stutzeri TaxID=316 RepID=A0A5S5BAW1_STUST|nr:MULTISPECIES: ectoine/hydroxyectoine ABC transporter permease subunit EhuC [Pseudomonadaceae]MAX89974.1 ectoine/hydroxyectoine ABC transporter permease subunit EhuC [Pseudomonas sp.]MBU1302478.1 ectoine/hydroxyectoine ABC transporter permease subunit EhuC [Gammaproteobacteria bacterium]MBK3849643.1 ectoine/hydroxyectoine ABC transporter permease subunit EhuC [Stutzerimonas xanthomarina]MBK58980.1 ectoine/hydroxyectoine ABC transporter permease subunit EhuC [Pseudomonas sp.]MBU1461564.1 ecto|tara:strand:+ start:16472 stop:17131 length:660 start_codon:yes stop_codon:yes gene_type:complete
MTELLPLLLQGAWVTVQITFFGSLLAIVAALIGALGRLSPIKPLRWLAIVYIEVFRGSSLLVQLFWLYFVLPMPPFNIAMSAFNVAVIGLGLNIGSYGAEVLRGAIRSVHEGQYEACQALNMTAGQRLRRVILPQALLAAIPPGTNLLIELLKNTSLVSLITLSDLAFRARQLDQATLMTLEIFGLALVMYFVLAQIINFSMRTLERRLARGRMRGGMS